MMLQAARLESLLPNILSPDKERIKHAIEMWNAGDVGTLVSLFSEDVAYCSPLIDYEMSESRWVQGAQEVAVHLLTLQKRFGKLELVDILIGAGFINLLLRHDEHLISMLIERDHENRARRIIVCHSQTALTRKD